MNLEDSDREIFEIAAFLDKDGHNTGSNLLFEYWSKMGRMDRLLMLTRDKKIDVRSEQIHYVISSDDVCNRLYHVLDSFLKGPMCAKSGRNSERPAFDVDQTANELIRGLKELNSIELTGWETFYDDLVNTAVLIMRSIDSLNIFRSQEKNVRFTTNASAESFFEGKVYFDYNKEIYFRYEVD